MCTTYIPRPIDTSDVNLTDELLELREAIAEHFHDVWASERVSEGWTYGEQRNNELKTHPCMVPYEDLPAPAKEYDRIMALDTIRLVKKLGFDIVKK